MQAKDYYQLLGVPRDASAADIKNAYRRQARKFHPDMNKASTATQSMADINEANAVLSDPEKREAYDTHGTLRDAPPVPPPNAQQPDFDAPPGWAEFFHFGDAPRVPTQGADRHASIVLDLKDAYTGTTKHMTVRSTESPGAQAGQSIALEVHIPRGVCAGQHIRLAGHGAAGLRGGAHGDLLLEVHFGPDARWRTEGRDVIGPLCLSPWEASLGPWLVVPTPTGEAEVKIPTPWRAGRRIRLKGFGIPGAEISKASSTAAKPPGDLYLELALALPPATTNAQKDAYSAMALAFADFRPRA